ncbi:MAG: hypothetical protein CEO21_341 [Microgenomates group bacterium Gr01-1014_80]|nr:MAG: hypothetical protein CEO21_341 [Microgenomates group bacterium Gr01-1014_80]
MDSINNRKLILSGLFLIVLSGGLFVLLNLTQNRTTIKSRADTNLVNIEIISPRQSSKVLGLTQVRATAEASKQPGQLSAVLQVDGSDSQPLEVSAVEGKVVITGKWDSSKYTQGQHNLKVFLYDKESSPLTLLGSSQVSVTVVPP